MKKLTSFHYSLIALIVVLAICVGFAIVPSTNKNKTMNSRENRMATLNNAGVDVSKFFDVTLPNGDVVKMTMENGMQVVVSDDNDPILNQIIEDGYVRNTKLHRRWVMAQMFKMLNYVSYNGRERGYDACLRNNYGYMYQFSMMLEEIRVLSILQKENPEAFEKGEAYDRILLSPKNLDITENDTENNVKASDIEVVKRDGKFYVLKGHDAVKAAVEQGKNLVAIKAMFE